jgi:hypothetical protein
MKNHPFLLTFLCFFWSTASLFSQVQVVSSAGNTAATNYTTLSGAFAAVNNGTHQGVITISISSNITETTTAILNASGGSANYSSVSIIPSGGAPYLITGNLPVLIDLNGADNVTINGLNSGGNGLIFENTNTAATANATIRLRNDATLNIIENCTILGASTANSYGNSAGNINSTSATIHLATGASGGTGNDNNSFLNCNIGDASTGLPSFAFNSHCGSTTITNDDISINNCNFYNYFNATENSSAIVINKKANNFNITGNSFYQTASRTFNAPTKEHCAIVALSDNATDDIRNTVIENNFFGGSQPFAAGNKYTIAGTIQFRLLFLSVCDADATEVKGNTFSNLDINTSSTNSTQAFIQVVNGKCNITNGNVFGSTTANNSISVTLPQNLGSTPRFSIIHLWTNGAFMGESNIKDNTFAGISYFASGVVTNYNRVPQYAAIFTSKTSYPNLAIENNVIGSASVTNSIESNVSATYSAINLQGSTNSTATIIRNNSITNITNLNTDKAAGVICIIAGSATTTNKIDISNNNISKITNYGNFNSGVVTNDYYAYTIGISISGGCAATINNNQLSQFKTFGFSSNFSKKSMIGIQNSSTNTSNGSNITNNTIQDFESNSNYNAYLPEAPAAAGIVINSDAEGQQINGNTIHNLTVMSTLGNTIVTGITVTKTIVAPGVKIYKNTIYDLKNTTDNQSAAKINGINIHRGGNSSINAPVVFNNTVSLNNNNSNNEVIIMGIRDFSATSASFTNYYYNTVNLYGHTSAITSSFAFYREVSNNSATYTSTQIIKNNIFNNTRTNAATNFFGNYAIGSSGNGTDHPYFGVTSNKNAFFVKNSKNHIGLLNNTGYTFAAWSAAALNQDVDTKNDTIVFIDHIANNLRLKTNNCILDGAAEPIASITDDFDAVTRDGSLPDIGAFEFTSIPPTAAVTGDAGVCSASPTTINIAFTSVPNWSFSYTINGAVTNVNHYPNPSYSFSVSPTVNTTYTITNLKSGSCYVNSFSIPTATVFIKPNYTWFGFNSNWFDPVNWCPSVPVSTSDVIIPNGTSYYPIITSGNALARNINIANNASITVSNTGRFNLYGSITNAGVFDLVDGTLVTSSPISQTISGSHFKQRTLKNLEIANTFNTNPVLSLNATLNDTLKISANLSFGDINNKTFATNNNLTLLSTESITASVNDLTNDGRNTGNAIVGNVNVERHIATARKWQLISINTSGAAQTVQNAWMEKQTPGIVGATNYGTWVTDAASAGPGFDAVSYTPSVKWFNGTGYTGITNPTLFNIKNKPAYFVFVRGDRTAQASNVVANQTVLRTYGTLSQNNTTAITVPAGANAICTGNPYASAVDLTKLSYSTIQPINIAVWDPKLVGIYGLGAFQYLTSSGPGADFTVMPGGGSYGPNGTVTNVIESGQGFFIQGAASSRNFNFVERAKTSQQSMVYRQAPIRENKLTISLFLQGTTNEADVLADGTEVRFLPVETEVDASNEFRKLLNNNENISIKSTDRLLAIQNKLYPQSTDTITINLANVRLRKYVLKLDLKGIKQLGLSAFLLDGYTNVTTSLPLDAETNYNFEIINVAGSYANNRFKIVFTQKALPKFVRIDGINNKQQGVHEIKWICRDEQFANHYTLEKSSDSIHFTAIKQVEKYNNGLIENSYQTINNDSENNFTFYRVKLTLSNGEWLYSKTIKIAAINRTTDLIVLSNPVENNEIKLLMQNMEEGNYVASLFSVDGKQILNKTIPVQNKSDEVNIKVPTELAMGNYILTISKNSSIVKSINILIKK